MYCVSIVDRDEHDGEVSQVKIHPVFLSMLSEGKLGVG